jgi:hypothetical protein
VRRLLDATVTGDSDAIADLVTADVTGWSPNLYLTSRDELLAALEQRDGLLPGSTSGSRDSTSLAARPSPNGMWPSTTPVP